MKKLKTVSGEELAALQTHTKHIRNICIVAHVDHGKTTLTDSLIAHNGVISEKLAGKVRFMDNTEEEQKKQITMKASSISLLYALPKKSAEVREKTTDSPSETDKYLINLVDSPGHVDFSGEVSSAVRLTDGALVVVDVVEGICIQTQGVLRQAWSEKLQPCLVLNKLDRLFSELHLTPGEAYERLKTILEQVNVLTSNLWKEDISLLYTEKANKEKENDEWTVDEHDDANVYFSPERGNVVFASATFGWAFRIHQFADIYAERLKIKRRLLTKTLWGEYYINMKSKRIFSRDPTGKMTPMFVQFILNNIWEVYGAITEMKEKKIQGIIKALALPIRPTELRLNDTEDTLRTVMSRWLPISNAVLGMVVEQIPSPVKAQQRRMAKLWNPTTALEGKALTREERQSYKQLVKAVGSCDASSSPDVPVVAFVSKVYAVDKIHAIIHKAQIRQPRPRVAPAAAHTEEEAASAAPAESEKVAEAKEKELETLEDDEEVGAVHLESKTKRAKRKFIAETDSNQDKIWIAMARIFSGTIKVDQKVHVLGPRYDPRTPDRYRTEIVIKELYLLMGKELEPVTSVPAGCIFGIGGVDDIILKTATISTSVLCPSFSPMLFGFAPIVRVAIEPKFPGDMPQLIEGLRLLNQADPCVEILVQETGEHVILASGELHLERCLADLQKRFAKIEMEVYPPIVSFRETIVADLNPKVKSDLVQCMTANKRCTIKMRAVPLPDALTALLDNINNQSIIRKLVQGDEKKREMQRAKIQDDMKVINNADQESVVELQKQVDTFKQELFEACNKEENGAFWVNELSNHLWSLGPKRVGSNMLLNHVPRHQTENSRFWQPLLRKLGVIEKKEHAAVPTETANSQQQEDVSDDTSFVSGFQMATASGPLCDEPITGVAFIVEDILITAAEAVDVDTFGPFSGQIISTMKDICRAAFMCHSVRLVEPMYLCDMQVTTSGLGKACDVLSRRRAEITDQDMKAGTDYFSVTAFLPVVESFGFPAELRDSTSGSASAQLVFSHYAKLAEDPFFVPTTEEELEEFGENAEALIPTLPRVIIDDVRTRKGLPVKKRIFARADAQRNLSKKK